ncbi:hypothetical protein [Streptomyces albireticuli]|uniref:hypothetical protein n=1 Tax=Streptomyces albireticuli TaxID=1940 RepID=UPI0011811401|nr:hypothetical protein [Streptomyces albireticuli]MCD9196087.1 hypothetical protein [Streptomyces albireticuli]
MTRLRRMLGRRGTILLAYGTVWALYGYGQLTIPQPDQRGLTLVLHLWPLSTWAWLWITAGTIAIAAAWMPPRRDWWGFLALVVIVIPWTLSYLASWWPLGIFPRGWVATAVWTVISVPVIVAAGWPEPPRPKGDPRP